MKKRNKGKYQKQPESNIRAYSFIVATVVLVVFGASAFLFYRMGEQSAATLQVTEPLATSELEEPYWEEPETVKYETQAIAVEPTAMTTEETTPVTEQTTQPLESVTPTADTLEESGRTATVLLSAGELKVRSGAGTSYSEVGRLKGGDAITVYEQKNVNGMMWGNIGYGWVAMDYVTFGADYSYTPQYQRSDYFGDWLTENKMCYMCITQNGNGADIRVVYTISKGTDMTWSMYGEFDEHGAIRYWNGVRKDHNGGVESVKYTNGEGAIVIDGLSLSWHESAEGPGEAGRFDKVFNYHPSKENPENTPNGSGVQQNPVEQSGTRGFSDNVVCDKVFAAFKKKIQGGYSGAELLYHSSSYTDGYVTYDPGRCTYSCSMTAEYCSNIFDMWGTSTSTYFVTAELVEKNGNLVLTKMDIK